MNIYQAKSSSSWSWIVSLLVVWAGKKGMQKRCTGDLAPPIGLICMRYESSSSGSWIVSLVMVWAGEKGMQKRCTGDPVPSSSLIRASILLSTRTPCWWRFNNPVSSLVWSLMIWPVLVWPQMLLHFYCSWMWIWEKGFLSQFLSRCFGFFLVWRAWLECWDGWCRWVL